MQGKEGYRELGVQGEMSTQGTGVQGKAGHKGTGVQGDWAPRELGCRGTRCQDTPKPVPRRGIPSTPSHPGAGSVPHAALGYLQHGINERIWVTAPKDCH